MPFTDEEICSGRPRDSHSWCRVGLGARLPYPQAVLCLRALCPNKSSGSSHAGRPQQQGLVWDQEGGARKQPETLCPRSGVSGPDVGPGSGPMGVRPAALIRSGQSQCQGSGREFRQAME